VHFSFTSIRASTHRFPDGRPGIPLYSKGLSRYGARSWAEYLGPLAATLALAALAALAFSGCSAATPPHPPAAVAPAPPPRDDGTPSKGGAGGDAHAAALEELKVGREGWRVDRQNSVRLLLPDAGHWTRVKFFGTASLVGFRYGKDHHAVVAGTVVHVDDETVAGACGKAFEAWAQPMVDAFEVAIEHDPPKAASWSGKIVDIDVLVAKTATLGMRDEYAVAYATYPAWKGSCLVIGIAIPARDELERAKAVRDRFAAEVLPTLQVLAKEEPKERY
jgi:hypothetical protein